MEAEEVEATCPPGKANDPRLVGMKDQPQLGEDSHGPSAGLLGPLSGGADDDEIVGVADQHPEPPTGPRPLLVEHVQGDIGQQRRDG